MIWDQEDLECYYDRDVFLGACPTFCCHAQRVSNSSTTHGYVLKGLAPSSEKRKGHIHASDCRLAMGMKIDGRNVHY